jgi:hypothetical protein
MLDRLRTIREVHAEPGHHLRVGYDDGASITLDFNPIIRQGGVFAGLADEQVFAKVTIGPRGRSICWPGDIDFCADALWLQAQSQDRRHAG